MKGRKPIPSALKILRGTKRGSSTNDEPQPAAAVPDCPPHLTEEARAEWERLAAELHQLGLLTRIDRAALAAYCVCWARWISAERQIVEQGEVVKSPNGYPIQNPYLSVANEALRQMKSYLVEFGLTPSSRTRIKIGPVQPVNKLSKYLTAPVAKRIR